MIQQASTRQSQTSTTYVVQSGIQQVPKQVITQGYHNHIAGDLNCPCCNTKIVGEVHYNQNNYVEKQEIKKTVKEKIIPNLVSNKKFVPNQNTKYCNIPNCTVCEGMYRLKEETEVKTIIHRDVSHSCDFLCKFCSYNAADARLLQLLEEHHTKMAELKRQREEELLKQQLMEEHQIDQQVEVQSQNLEPNSRLCM
ncbi:hypothetical protein ABPG72_016061 [Tetrahymena utriculariae]